MARYNHFAPLKFEPINFNAIEIGTKFRFGKYKGKRHRFIMATKISELSYQEIKSKITHTVFHTDFTVYEYKQSK